MQMQNHIKPFKAFNESVEEVDGEWYYGIADCKGLESFMPAPNVEELGELEDMGFTGGQAKSFNHTLSMMSMRCHFNQQRHPVVYMAKLAADDAEMVQDLLDSGDYINALEVVKANSIEVKLARGQGANLEKRWRMIPNPDLDPMSEGLEYHITNNLSVCESIYRPASDAHFSLLAEARSRFESGELALSGIDQILFEETDLGLFGEYGGELVPLDFLFEAEYQGRSVELGKPARGGAKKYHVYVMNPKTKRVKKISFGDVHGGLTAKVSDPKARKSFAARHQCHLKNDRLTAGYWACRINRYANLWGGKTYPGFW